MKIQNTFKFDFSQIQNPTMAENSSNRIEGTLPDGTPVAVERHLSSWDVHLKIVIDGTVYHDYDVQPDEKKQFEELRNRTFVHKSDEMDKKRAHIGKLAAQYLRPKA